MRHRPTAGFVGLVNAAELVLRAPEFLPVAITPTELSLPEMRIESGADFAWTDHGSLEAFELWQKRRVDSVVNWQQAAYDQIIGSLTYCQYSKKSSESGLVVVVVGFTCNN